MARRRVRFKPSPKAICKVMTSDDAFGRIHTTDMGGRGMTAWLLRHKHVRPIGHRYFSLTAKGKKLGDKACDVSFGR